MVVLHFIFKKQCLSVCVVLARNLYLNRHNYKQTPDNIERVEIMPLENISKHLSFMRELDYALDEALEEYKDADEHELEELRHVKREVLQARRTMFIFIEKKRKAQLSETKRLDKIFTDGLQKGVDSGLLKPDTTLPL